MTELTKTRTVLQAQGWVKGGPTSAPRDRMLYAADYDEGVDAVRTTELHLDKDVYCDMASPRTVTVTVEPGDMLNAVEPEQTELDAFGEGYDKGFGDAQLEAENGQLHADTPESSDSVEQPDVSEHEQPHDVLTHFEAMYFDGTIPCYQRILQWMKDCGDTNALAGEVIYSTPMMRWPGALGFKAANRGDWIVKNGGQGFTPMIPR